MVLATIAALISFLGVLMVVMSFASRRENPVGARVRNLAAHLSEDQGPDLTRPFGQRVVWPLFEGIANAFARLLPTTFVSRISYLLTLAGKPVSLGEVAEPLPDPLADNRAPARHHMGLARSRRDALRDIGERTGVPDVITF